MDLVDARIDVAERIAIVNSIAQKEWAVEVAALAVAVVDREQAQHIAIRVAKGKMHWGMHAKDNKKKEEKITEKEIHIKKNVGDEKHIFLYS